MHGPTSLFLVGLFGAFALVMSWVARRWLPISEVVAFLAIGLVLGPRVLGVIDRTTLHRLSPLTDVALGAMVFLIGRRLRLADLRSSRRTLLPIALAGSAAAFLACLLVLLAAGVRAPIAYLLAAIAPSTAPATVQAIVAERRARGTFTDHLLAATALNTLVAALLFGFGAPFVFADLAAYHARREAIHSFVQLVVESLVVGAAAGAVLLVARARLERWGDRFLLVWIVLVLAVGAADALNSSVVITTLVAGAVAGNGPHPAPELYDAVRVLEAPMFLVFFIVTGASVHVHQFASLGGVGVAYVLARAAGRTLGSWGGAVASRPARAHRWGPWIGIAQLPYAGMAVGLASYTVDRTAAAGAPGAGTQVAALVLGSVFLFEVATPLVLERALIRVGDSEG